MIIILRKSTWNYERIRVCFSIKVIWERIIRTQQLYVSNITWYWSINVPKFDMAGQLKWGLLYSFDNHKIILSYLVILLSMKHSFLLLDFSNWWDQYKWCVILLLFQFTCCCIYKLTCSTWSYSHICLYAVQLNY